MAAVRGKSFRAVEPQAPVTREEMRFGIWLGAWDLTAAEHTTPAEFQHWHRFYETRIWGPTVEWVPAVDTQLGVCED